MKKVFTLAVILSTAIAANAQSKSDVSTTRKVEQKQTQKVESAKASAQLENKLKTKSSTQTKTTGIISQTELNARKEEIKNNPKTSTKPVKD